MESLRREDDEEIQSKTSTRSRKASAKTEQQGARTENSLALNKSRAGYLGVFTKIYKEVKDLLKNTGADNLAKVSRKRKEIDEAFQSYEEASERYFISLDHEEESEEKREAIKSFEKEYREKVEILNEVEIWLTQNTMEIIPHDSVSQTGLSTSSSLKLQAQASKVIATMKLAQLEEEELIEEELSEILRRKARLKVTHEAERASAECRVYDDAEKRSEERITLQINSDYSKAGIPSRKAKTRITDIPVTPPSIDMPAEMNQAQGNKHVSNTEIDCPSNPQKGDPLVQLLKQQQQMMLSMANALVLPKPELTPFDGSPLNYWRFMRNFEKTIEFKASSDSERLNYLLQYCSSKVRELIGNCVVMDPNEGYTKAKKMLKERFGDPYTIACASIQKVTEGPPLKSSDRSGLQALADKLKDCEMTLQSIGYIDDVNSTDNLRKIAEQLPFHLRGRWLERARGIREKGRRPSIEDLAGYISQTAKAANDPVFGQIMDTPKEKVVQFQKRIKPVGNRPNSFSVQTQAIKKREQVTTPSSSYRSYSPSYQNNSSGCPSCGGNHYLSKCEEFQKMSYIDKCKLLRMKWLCDNCFKPGHIARDCQIKSLCQVEGCNRNHNSLVHPPKQLNERSDSTASVNVHSNAVELNTTKKSVELLGRKRVCLPIVPVRVCGKDRKNTVVTYALLDKGSDTSLCEKGLASSLGLKGDSHTYSLTTIEKKESQKQGEVVELIVMPMYDDDIVELPAVITVDKIPISQRCIAKEEDVYRWPHLEGIQIPEIDSKVTLLIGNDVPEVFWVQEERRGRRKEPYAVKSILGWTLEGPIGNGNQGNHDVNVNFVNTIDPLQEQLQKFWQMDHEENGADPTVVMSVEDRQALKKMESSIELVDGHYQLGLPWKSEEPYLPNNRLQAERRLEMLRRRLMKDDQLLEKYKASVSEYLDKGFARKVPEKELKSEEAVWYLPHHPVINPNKPGKVRVVFDCAASYKGTSLNDQLLQGPDLTNSLFGVLTRFRQEKVALIADIEGMFNQVRVNPEDRNALRFLWWPDGQLKKRPVTLQMLVHLFGATSSPSCANFSLRKTAQDNKEEFKEETVTTVERNFYVDDCLKSVKSVDDAVNLSEELRQMLSRGGFRLTKWLSNKREVIDAIPDSERAKSVKNLDLEKFPVERALGVQWDVETDKLGFKINPKEKPYTRRGMLSVTSSVYDPLGLVAPFVLSAKKMMQDLCREKIGWDEPVPEECLKKWKQWLSDLPRLSEVRIDRCFKPEDFGEITSIQLHNFADASMIAYGAVSYLRMVNIRGEIHCCFVTAKSRLAPVKIVTIPRLELSAAVLAVALDGKIKKELDLPIEDSFFWTDSTSVLQYIKNEKRRFKIYVANRVAAIHDGSTSSQWRHVDTKSNPADDASRGLLAEQIVKPAGRWFKGPSFLWKTEEYWPALPKRLPEIPEDDEEVKSELQSYAVQSAEAEDNPIERFINKYSSWYRLKKGIAWLMRFKAYLIGKYSAGRRDSADELRRGNLKIEEIKKAEREIVKYIQKEEFKEEIEKIQSKIPIKKTSTIFKLSPELKNGILQVGGRLEYAEIEDEAKHPPILPKQHHVTTLIVRHFHLLSCHGGREHVLSLLRQRFWIVKARVVVRHILNKCLNCRRRNAPPGEQQMANLPKDRLTPDKPPFTYVGVDCFGPFYVKQGRSSVKRYGCLFTCLVVRAIHIEVIHSLETDSFIDALHRFMSRRGRPEVIRSDNGTNFRGGERELREGIKKWNQTRIEEALRQKEIKWLFNPPAASNFGGVWERMIRSARSILRVLLRQQIVTDETLNTLMAQVEAIMNSRPLTKFSDDPNDEEALTPNHVLLLRPYSPLPPGVFAKEDLYVKRRWKQVQYLADQFWRRWVKEYLPSLQERQRWLMPQPNHNVNDLVLVVDETTPRGEWPLGKVIEVRKAKDGLVRSVRIKTRNGILVRPINKICLLEAFQKEEEMNLSH